MKAGRSAGLDKRLLQLIKHVPEIMYDLFAYGFILFHRGDELAEEWKNAYVSNLIKKGNR